MNRTKLGQIPSQISITQTQILQQPIGIKNISKVLEMFYYFLGNEFDFFSLNFYVHGLVMKF